MKTTCSLAFLLVLFCFPRSTPAQIPDSLAGTRQVDSLIQLSRTLAGQAKYKEALQVIETAKKKAEEVFGAKSAGYAACVFNQGRVLYLMRKYSEVEPLYLEAKNIREKVLGREHPDYAQSLYSLAMLYTAKGKYDEALSSHLEAKAIRAKVLGKEHPDYAHSLNSLANVYYFQGEYDKALTLHLEAKNIREKVLGKEHPDYAQSLNGLAAAYDGKFDYDNAEPLYLEAVTIREKVLGKEHPHYATSLNNLATVYCAKIKYDNALPLFLEAMTIREKVLGREHPDYAQSLNNLGSFYRDIGEYDKALTLYLEAKAIREKVLGREHPDYAYSLNNLATVFLDIGEYDKALTLYLEAKTIWEKVFGKEHPNYAQSLNNLANVYFEKGEYDKAGSLHLEAKTIRAKTLGKEHPDYAQSLHNLAFVYTVKGDYDKAVPLYIEAITIWEIVFGKEHPNYAASLNNLANVYAYQGEYDKALPLHLEAKTIQEKALGKEHPSYARSLYNLAGDYWDKGDRTRAVTYFLSSNTATKSLLQKSATYSSEKEMLQYRALFEERFNALLRFTQNCPTDSFIFGAYDNALFFKNALLDAAIGLEKSIRRSADSSARDLYAEWKSALFQLNKWYSRPIAGRDSNIVARLEEKASLHEKELIRLSPAFVESRRVVTWRQVRDRLQPGSAAIEFIHYRCHDDKKTAGGSGATPADSTMYTALVLLPGDTAPHFVPLFEERQLQNLLHFPGVDERYIVRNLYANKKDLYRLLLAPLMPLLSEVETVYFAPSGLIHRLNPGALEDESDSWVSENRSWVRLGSTGELVMRTLADRSFAANDTAPLTAAVFGGIRYDIENEQDSFAFAAVNPLDIADNSHIPFRKDGIFFLTVEAHSANRKSETRGNHENNWDFLPVTRLEADETAGMLEKAGFQVEKFSDYLASEERFKKISKRSPRILHIATHGFAYPDPKTNGATRGAFADDQPAFKLSDNPMLRSGLLLSGANFYWKNHRPLSLRDDGVLVACEVRDLDFQNTELAVLSACQTGLGEAVGSEGIYGLQRAFKIAGARFLLVSLWHVPDEQTREMMQIFYQNWLSDTVRLSLREAFALAQRQMREKYPDPFLWAGFVLVE